MKYGIVFLLGVALVGCTRGLESDERPAAAGLALTASGADWRSALASQAGLIDVPSAAGKATETAFQPKDELGVFLYALAGNPAAVGSGPYHSTNMRYFTLDGSPDGSTSPQWKAGAAMGGALGAGTTYCAVAYYPFKEGATNASAVPHAVATDQTASAGAEATALERSDFLWAAPVEVQTPTSHPSVALTFAHAMTKMVVDLEVPLVIDGYPVVKATGLTIKGLKTSCTVDLGTGAATNLADAADITPRKLSGDLSPGKRAVWEAVVVPQALDVNYALIEVVCETSNGGGTRRVNYFPPGAGLTLEGGKKITFSLLSSADLAITSQLDLFTGVAETGLPLKVKTAGGTAWTLSSSQPWLTLSTTAGGTYAASISGTGTGADQTVYVKTLANTGSGAVSRDAVLTLSATLSGVVRSVTYRAVQNYSVPVTGFPETYVWMAGCQYEMPKVKGNSKWYIKASSLPAGVKFSTRNVAWADLQPADVVDVVSLTNTGSKLGFEVLGNYFNTGGALYVVTDPTTSPLANVVCNGVNVTIDARTVLIETSASKLRWARGNLVASGARGAAGLGGCKIGGPMDAGLYFQFGSLIGWKGGGSSDPDRHGNGEGITTLQHSTKNWEGRPFSWANDAYCWPNEMTIFPTVWPAGQTTTKWYFGVKSGEWIIDGKNIRNYPGFVSGSLAQEGVGDPCTYYLGAEWRVPTAYEFADICGLAYETIGTSVSYPAPGILARFVSSAQPVGAINYLGMFLGGDPNTLTEKTMSEYVYFPFSGRRWGDGLYTGQESRAHSTTTIVSDGNNMRLPWFANTLSFGTMSARYLAVPARCVLAI